MEKAFSTEVKGVAILFMLWGHLFPNLQVVDSLCNLIYIGNEPFSLWIKPAIAPVPIFLFLSGYGMHVVNTKLVGDANRYRRVLRLYLTHWIVMFTFVTIGFFVNPAQYPGSFIKLLGNFTGIDPSYNTALWFLLPYVLLALSAKWIVRLFARYNAFVILGAVYLVGTSVSWWISRHTVFLNHYRLIYIICEYVALMFPFVLGISCSEFKVFQKWKKYFCDLKYCGILSWLGIVLMTTLMCAVKPRLIFSIYMLVMLLLFYSACRPRWLCHTLTYLGKYSMCMWMVHSYFYAYLFHDFIYGFRYPVVIFCVLLTVSLLSSLLLQNVSKSIFEYFSKPRSL